MNIISSFNFDSKVGREKNTKPSLTVPDQTLSLEEILRRYTRGQTVATLTPVYHGDGEFPDFDRMDPMERLDYARDLKADLNKAANKLKASKKEATAQDSPIGESKKVGEQKGQGDSEA